MRGARRSANRLLTAGLLVLVVLGSCATTRGTAEVSTGGTPAEGGVRPKSDAAADVVSVARSLVGQQRLAGSPYTLDCSGLVLHIHAAAGVALDDPFARAAGNGVKRLYTIGADAGVMTAADAIRPGDVIFWDNSYDRNENGLWDDPLTHTGVAVAVDAKGTVTFVHHHYRNGVVLAQMNAGRPDDPELNSPMRMRGQRVPGHPEYTAGHLFRAAARLYELAER